MAVGVAPQLGGDPAAAQQEPLMAKGTQGLDRNDMMSSIRKDLVEMKAIG